MITDLNIDLGSDRLFLTYEPELTTSFSINNNNNNSNNNSGNSNIKINGADQPNNNNNSQGQSMRQQYPGLRRYDGAKFKEKSNYYLGDFNNDEVTIKIPQKPTLDELSMANNNFYLNKLEQINEYLQKLFQKKLKQSNTMYDLNRVDDVSKISAGDHDNARNKAEAQESSSEKQKDSKNEREDSNDHNGNDESHLIDQLISTLVKLNTNYPINNLDAYLAKLKDRNVSLSKEINELMAISKEISVQLRKYNIDLDDKELLQFQKTVAKQQQNQQKGSQKRLASGSNDDDESKVKGGPELDSGAEAEVMTSEPAKKKSKKAPPAEVIITGKDIIEKKKKELEELKRQKSALLEKSRS